MKDEICKFCDGSGEGLQPDSKCSYCSQSAIERRLYEEYAEREED